MAAPQSAMVGCLLGTAVGDALGLAYEGLSRRRAARLLGEPNRYRLLPGRGLVSDDTEHACLTAQALIAAPDDEEEFLRQLARRLRGWILSLPAGTGLATLRATLKLACGISPRRSGVFSAGNGPAMRSPILGIAVEDPEQLKRLVRAATRITHTDPLAEAGALAVAWAAQVAKRQQLVEPPQFVGELRTLLADLPAEPLHAWLEAAAVSVDKGESTQGFAESRGMGQKVSGYILHTVPVVVHAWLSHPADFRAAVTAVIRCGGDTDTTAAIVGGIVGSSVGKEGIPGPLLAGLGEWPRTVAWMESLAEQLHAVCATKTASLPPRLPVWGVLARNLLFAAIVLAHGFRRLAPPY